LSELKKYHPSGNLKFNKLGIFQSLKLRNLMEKILRISFKLNFTPNTFGWYGLSLRKIGRSFSEVNFHSNILGCYGLITRKSEACLATLSSRLEA